jgi:hypothetical protein
MESLVMNHHNKNNIHVFDLRLWTESFCSIHKKKSESSKELFCVQFY